MRLASVFPFLKPYRFALLGAFLALCLTTSAVLGIGKGLAYLIDHGFRNGNPHVLDQALLFLLLAVTLLATGTYCRYFLITMTGE